MSLKRVLDEMEAVRPQAEMDVQMGSPETYGGRIGLKRAGMETLKRLKLEYRSALMFSTAFIVVTGPARNSFSELASAEPFDCFSTDPEEFYKDLVSRISPSLFGRESTKNLFNIAGNILEDKAMELDIASYPMLMFNDKYNSSVTCAEDLVPLIRDAVNSQVGPEIVGISAVNSVVDRAIEKKHSASVTPVILNTADEKFASDLQKDLKRLTSKVFLVVAGKTNSPINLAEGVVHVKKVSQESVGEALDTIRNKVL